MPQDSYRSRPREEDDGPRLNVVDGAQSDKEARGLKRKDYEDSLRDLHVKLVELQEWVRHKGGRSASSSRDETAPARAARSRPLRPG